LIIATIEVHENELHRGLTAKRYKLFIPYVRRCVDEKDKPVAMGMEGTILSIFAFIPSIIFYGYIIGKFPCKTFTNNDFRK